MLDSLQAVLPPATQTAVSELLTNAHPSLPCSPCRDPNLSLCPISLCTFPTPYSIPQDVGSYKSLPLHRNL